MPFFKSTYNILKTPWEDEVWNRNWADSDKIILPPNSKWTYDREMIIEDVDIWEVLHEESGNVGVYASWCPYAEFYMITAGIDYIRTFYGIGAIQKVVKEARKLNIILPTFDYYYDDSDSWLYNSSCHKKSTFIKNL
jgi:hypothetical protein